MNRLLAELRGLAPNRRLTAREAFVVAERQASRLLTLSGVTDPPVPEEIITDLPFVKVARRSPMRNGGATRWLKPRWVVLINGADPAPRQRFSLGHEFKHIIDHPAAGTLYNLADPATRAGVERVCEYFAACLLMPKVWLRRAWTAGIQSEAMLAELFDVSLSAMQIRLLQLGLLELPPRCGMDNTYLRSRTGSPLLKADLALRIESIGAMNTT